MKFLKYILIPLFAFFILENIFDYNLYLKLNGQKDARISLSSNYFAGREYEFYLIDNKDTILFYRKPNILNQFKKNIELPKFYFIIENINGLSDRSANYPLLKILEFDTHIKCYNENMVHKGDLDASGVFTILGICSKERRRSFVKNYVYKVVRQHLKDGIGGFKDYTCRASSSKWRWYSGSGESRSYNNTRIQYNSINKIKDSLSFKIETPCRTISIPDSRGDFWRDTLLLLDTLYKSRSDYSYPVFIHNVIECDIKNSLLKSDMYYSGWKKGLHTEFNLSNEFYKIRRNQIENSEMVSIIDSLPQIVINPKRGNWRLWDREGILLWKDNLSIE